MHYAGTVWRPPYESSSLLIEITAGCTHHKCKFCTLYDDLPFKFRMSPLEDVEEDLKEAQGHYKLWSFRKVSRTFLVGANPFVLKSSRLLEIASLIQKYFPSNQSIGCFARITDITIKKDEELSTLRKAGYDGITIGIETGDNDALAFMNKGYQAEDILTQCKRLDTAGIHYNFFYLTGISGLGKGEKGARNTTNVCNQLNPQIIGASMLTIFPNSELYKEIEAGHWQEETEIEKYRELRTLADNLNIPVWFAVGGASNAIPIQGTFPKDKKKVVSVLDKIIKSVDEKELRDYRTNLRHL